MVEKLREASRIRLALLALGSVVILFAALAPDSLESVTRAWTLTTGFSIVAASVIGTSRRFAMPAILSVILVVFCGFSAVVAVPEPLENSIARAHTLDEDTLRAAIPARGYTNISSDEGFRYAAKVTGLGGLAAMLAAILTAALMSAPAERVRRRNGRIERAGRVLVLIGFLGVAGALTRFGLTQFPVEDLWDSFKSFWIGGTYLLLIATFAVPGFALWVQGLVGRGAPRREFRAPMLLATLFVALLIPTGQRGFLIALGVMLLAILLANRVIDLKWTAVLVAAGIFSIGLTQAVRNEASGQNRITAAGFVERIQPDQWKDLYSSQVASFNWTILVHENRERLDIPNSFVALLAKPIPRSIYPDKSQGFGDEFTRRVFPDAASQEVSFATPFVAEVDYNVGVGGVIVLMGLLGFFVVFLDRKVAQRAPPLVEPVVAATIFWFAFEVIRGDLANALIFSAGWIIPLILFSRAIGLRRDPALKRMIVDALQVAPQFSGIGRRIEEIGNGFRRNPPSVPIEVRCARDVVEELRPRFPESTTFHTPVSSSRPRSIRILYQQLIAPVLTGPTTLILSPGDQAPLWGRSPLLFVIHDVRRLSAPETAKGRIEAFYYKLVMKTGARRAEQVLTISEFSKSEIDRYLKPLCPVSIVSEQPRDIEPIDRDALVGNPPQYLVVGALRKYKGLETVVTALARMDGNEQGVTVNCVGDSGGEPEVAEEIRQLAASLGVEDRFRILGWLDDEELGRLYGTSAGTISPSSYEGYGLSVTTSLAFGLPTLASDIPPHRETGGEAAVYFSPGDSDSLASALGVAAFDPEGRLRMGEQALERHRALLSADRSWSKAVDEFLVTYPA